MVGKTILVLFLSLSLAYGSSNGDCNPTQCPQSDGPKLTLLPVPWDCKQYIMCQWGVAHYRPCGFGLYYDHNRTVCMPPYMTDCNICDLHSKENTNKNPDTPKIPIDEKETKGDSKNEINENSEKKSDDKKDGNKTDNSHMRPTSIIPNNPTKVDQQNVKKDGNNTDNPQINKNSTVTNNQTKVEQNDKKGVNTTGNSQANGNSTTVKPTTTTTNTTTSKPTTTTTNTTTSKPTTTTTNTTTSKPTTTTTNTTTSKPTTTTTSKPTTTTTNTTTSKPTTTTTSKPTTTTTTSKPATGANVSQKCVSNSSTPVKCPENMADDRLMPHPDDCGLFYQCVDFSTPICRECPANLHFNPTKKVCDFPDTAGCKVQKQSPAFKYYGNECDYDLNRGSGTQADMRPNPKDCTKFFACVWGHLVPMSCPDNEHFNPSLRVCDNPKNAGCVAKS